MGSEMDRSETAGLELPSRPLRVLMVGLGSIGRRHLLNLRAIQPNVRITLLRQQAKTRPDLPCEQVIYDWDQALAGQYDVAVIASPASQHIHAALALAQNKVHLFIEKPLSNKLEGVDGLIARCHQNNSVLMVGYTFRFYRPLQLLRQAILEGRIGRVLSASAEAGQYLPDWRSDQDVRKSISGQSKLGGGVVLELSHEIDYLRWLVGEVQSVSAQMGHLSDLAIDVEDVAEITMRFHNGALGHVHLDMIQRPSTRGCRIVGTEGQLTWNAQTNAVKCYSMSAGTWLDLHPEVPLDRNIMYLEEMRHFLECARDRHSPASGGEEGRRVLEIALAAKQSAQEQRVIEL